jgi:hypothetical protein
LERFDQKGFIKLKKKLSES